MSTGSWPFKTRDRHLFKSQWTLYTMTFSQTTQNESLFCVISRGREMHFFSFLSFCGPTPGNPFDRQEVSNSDMKISELAQHPKQSSLTRYLICSESDQLICNIKTNCNQTWLNLRWLTIGPNAKLTCKFFCGCVTGANSLSFYRKRKIVDDQYIWNLLSNLT